MRVCGLIGHAISANKKSASVAETEIGIANTSAWKMCGISPKTTVAVYFEVVSQHGQPLQPGSRGLIQFLTHYQHSSGQFRLRVTHHAILPKHDQGMHRAPTEPNRNHNDFLPLIVPFR